MERFQRTWRPHPAPANLVALFLFLHGVRPRNLWCLLHRQRLDRHVSRSLRIASSRTHRCIMPSESVRLATPQPSSRLRVFTAIEPVTSALGLDPTVVLPCSHAMNKINKSLFVMNVVDYCVLPLQLSRSISPPRQLIVRRKTPCSTSTPTCANMSITPLRHIARLFSLGANITGG